MNPLFEKETITLTFCDRGESHVGMEAIGEYAKSGFTLEDLEYIKSNFPNSCSKIYHLNELLGEDMLQAEDAYILVIRNGCSEICSPDILLQEQQMLESERDKKAFMKGRVVNKIARHNLLFGDIDQVADFEKKQSSVINYNRLPELTKLKNKLNDILKMSLQCEANYYYNISKCYISEHNDFERRIVVSIRLGNTFPLHFRWYHRFKPISDFFSIDLNHGDFCIFSAKSVGTDGRKSSIYTLKHAAGDLKIINKKKKK